MMELHLFGADAVKLGLVSTTSGAVLTDLFVGNQALPFFQVSITTVGMAIAGSLIAFAYGTPVNSRKKLYGYAIGNTFLGIWAVQLLPGRLGWDWVTPDVAAPLAGAFALAARWVVPILLETLPNVIRKFLPTGNPPA